MIIDAPIMNKTLENIKLIFSTIFFLAGIIVFLSALGWNDQHIGHQIGGNMGNTIANLGNSRHWGANYSKASSSYYLSTDCSINIRFSTFFIGLFRWNWRMYDFINISFCSCGVIS